MVDGRNATAEMNQRWLPLLAQQIPPFDMADVMSARNFSGGAARVNRQNMPEIAH